MKNRLFSFLTLFIIFFFLSTSFATQQNMTQTSSSMFASYSNQMPTGQNLKVIETQYYEVIFPKKIEKDAQRVANIMERLVPYHDKTLKINRKQKVPILLINQNTESNGFVMSVPLLSHWYSTPSSFMGLEWYKGLAVHEGRHMVQYMKMKQGSRKFWYYLAGDGGLSAFSALYVPIWFAEGDAVLTETLLSNGGRGRIASFDLWLRTMELSGIRYNYFRAYLGGEKDNYPYANYYLLGYLLNTHLRKKYGKEIWNNSFNNLGKYILLPNFNYSIKSITKKNLQSIYNDTMKDIGKLWKEQQAKLTLTKVNKINIRKNENWSGYISPFQISKNSFLTIKGGVGKESKLISLSTDGKEKVITQIPSSVFYKSSITFEKGISFGKNLALWTEKNKDMRWGYKNFQNLFLYNIVTKKKSQLSFKKKYINSTISKDDKLIAATHFNEKRKSSIDIINIENKKIILKQNLKRFSYSKDLSFSNDNSKIVMVIENNNGSSIQLLDFKSKLLIKVIEFSKDEQFHSPIFYKNYIIYSSGYSGIDNIYAIDLLSKKRFQITSRPYGAYFPHVFNNNSLIFNDYSINGFSCVSMKLNNNKWKKIEDVDIFKINYFESLLAQEQNKSIIDEKDIPKKKYKVEDYSSIKNAVNIHTWIPGIDLAGANLFMGLHSSNVLQTLFLSGGYIYNYNEKTHAATAYIDYRGIYPILQFSTTYGERAIYDQYSTEKHLTWHEKSVQAIISLPLNLSKGLYYRYLTLSSNFKFTEIENKSRYQNLTDTVDDGILKSVRYGLQISNQKENNSLNIKPHWAQILNFNYIHTPFGGDNKGEKYSITSAFYFPGFYKNNSLYFKAAFEKQNPLSYYYSSSFLFSRGYDAQFYKKIYKTSINYSLPLLYLDVASWPIETLFYFKKLSLNVFYDYLYGQNNNNSQLFRSVGAEITIKHNIFSNRFLILNSGLRYSKCLDNNENKIEFVIMM